MGAGVDNRLRIRRRASPTEPDILGRFRYDRLMATAELAVGSPKERRRHRPLRCFFMFMLGLAVAILALAFVPEFYAFAQGTFPIAPILHVHAALMAAWVVAFAVQAYLGMTGRIVQHQRTGRIAMGFAWAAWASMVFVEWRALVVHPLPDKLTTYDELLPGPYIYLTFPLLLAWAYRERRRPMWHKRLMLFALFVSLGAAVQRYLWLPIYHSRAGYWPIVAFIDLSLLVPLFSFDLIMLKGRLHPATVRGTALLFFAQAIMLSLWGTSSWREFAYNASQEIQRMG